MRLEDATARDLQFIAPHLRRMNLDDENLNPSQFVVARAGDGDAIIGFGRIKPYDGEVYELAGVGVLEAARGAGLGAAIVQELIRRFPVDDVYITTNLPDYFARFGFAITDVIPAPLQDKLERVCGSLRAGVVAMRLRRR